MTPYKKLTNQPLTFVLAEFRFTPVMAIENYVASMQDVLRKQYPIPNQRHESVLEMQSGGIAVQRTLRWAFVSKDRKSSVEISQDRLICSTVDYDRFPAFSENCEQVIDHLIEIVEPSLLRRVGLRYGDLIVLDEGEKYSEMVNGHYDLPPCFDGVGTATQHHTQAYLTTLSGTMLIRTMAGHFNYSCLPDIHGMPIAIEQDQNPSDRIILDFDHSWDCGDESVNFEKDRTLGILEGLHEASRAAFWNMTTEGARKKWQ